MNGQSRPQAELRLAEMLCPSQHREEQRRNRIQQKNCAQGNDGETIVRGDFSNLPTESGDIVLKLLHTADWHLGRRFPSFPEDAQKRLSRARMDVIANILAVARRNPVHALLCAGDLFDDPEPEPDFWEGLARTLRERGAPHPPIFLIPGNHDPLTPESVWALGHPFRARLPEWVHVVDRDDFTYELSPDVILHARRVDPRRAKTIWPWRFQAANLAMRDFVSVASTAPPSTLMGIRRTSRFAEMPASNADSTISQ